jgi:hypothetical protein
MPASEYSRVGDFTDDELANKAGRDSQDSAQLDAEYDALLVVVNDHAADLNLLLRDDDNMVDNILLGHEFSASALTYLKGALGNQNAALVWEGSWLQNTDYEIGSLAADTGVSDDVYYCLVAHNSGAAHADLSAYIAANPTHWEVFVPGTTIAFPSSPSASDVLCRNIGNTAEVWKKIGSANTDGSFAPNASPTFTGTVTVPVGVYTGLQTFQKQAQFTVHDYGSVSGTSQALDFAEENMQKITLTGLSAIDFTTSNRAAGRTIELFITASASDRVFTGSEGWNWMGYKPPTILANKDAVLTLKCLGTGVGDVWASYIEEL